MSAFQDGVNLSYSLSASEVVKAASLARREGWDRGAISLLRVDN